MRGKRSKQYRKLMQQYGLTFGFREPYQVLVDAQMLQDAFRFKMDLVGQLGRTLHGEIKPMITQCSIRHLYALPVTSTATATSLPTTATPTVPQTSPVSPATKTSLLTLSKSLTLRRCGHHTLPSPLSPLECIASVLDPNSSGTNKHHLILACQDETVRRWGRGVRGVPSVYVKRSVMVMEPMTEESRGTREGVEKGKLRGGVVRKAADGAGAKRKRQEGEKGEARGGGGGGDDEQDASPNGNGAEDEGAKRKKTKVWGTKGPNPLSVKKKKPEGQATKGQATKGQATKGQGAKADGRRSAEPEVRQGGEDEVEQKKKRKRKHKPSAVGGGDDDDDDDGGGAEAGVEVR